MQLVRLVIRASATWLRQSLQLRGYVDTIGAGTCRPRRNVRAVAIRHQREDLSERRMPVRRFNRGGRAF